MRVDTAALDALAGRWPRRVPRAIAKAMNDVAASHGVPAAREGFRRDFTVRGQWEIMSLRHTWARPSALRLTIGSLHPYLGPALVGGERAEPGAVPQVGRGLPRARPESRTPRARWPSGYLGHGEEVGGVVKGLRRTFLLHRDSGAALLQRVGRGPASRLRTLYVWTSKVRIKPRWGLEGDVRRAYAAGWRDAVARQIRALVEGR